VEVFSELADGQPEEGGRELGGVCDPGEILDGQGARVEASQDRFDPELLFVVADAGE
jgi:hypothetical protein